MNNTFDKTRFWNLLKWDIVTSKRELLAKTIGMASGLSLMYLFIMMTQFDGKEEPISLYTLHYVNSMVTSTNLVATFIMYLSLSLIFTNIKNKGERLLFLTLPCSNLEKFLARYVHVTVVYPLCFICAVLVASLVQYILSFAFIEGGSYFVIEHWVTTISSLSVQSHDEVASTEIIAMFYFTSVLVLINAFCIFGGTIFRKNAWLKTILLAFVVMIFMVLMITLSSDSVVDFVYHLNYIHGWEVLLIMALGQYLIATLLYIMSYKIFTRMQIISNKWINL